MPIILNILKILLLSGILATLSICMTLLFYGEIRVLMKLKFSLTRVMDTIKISFSAIIVKPIMEELLFRYYLFYIIDRVDSTQLVRGGLFILIASFAFSISHMPNNWLCFWEKIFVGGMLYSLLYVWFYNIVLLVTIHIIHNLFILYWRSEEKCNE